MAAIELSQLTRSYGKRRGILDVSLQVNRGEIFGFLGPNGAGKSTTIRILLGFLKASAGQAHVFGHDCWTDSTRVRQETGYVAGDVRLYPWLTLRRALGFVSHVRKCRMQSFGNELARRFQLEPDLPVRKMSRGNRQKLALILALAHRPQLAILDEPGSGLDPLMQDTLADCLREMAAEGRTVFLSSHTLSEVESLCRRVAVIRDGRLAACEEIESLRQRAPRVVHLTFDSEQAASSLQCPDFLNLRSRDGCRCEFHLNGPAVRLTQWCADHHVRDLDISPPNLESVFRDYYTPNDAT